MEKQNSILKYSFGPGLVLGAISIIYAVVLYVLNADVIENSWLGWINHLILIAAIVYYQNDYKKNYNEGFLSYGEGVKLGVTIAVIAGIIGAIYSYIFNTMIDPEYVESMLLKVEAQMAENPQMTQEAIDTAMGFTRKMADPVIQIPTAIIGSAIGGLIFSLIVTAFTKKSNAPV
jgi:general stress protein CsbA